MEMVSDPRHGTAANGEITVYVRSVPACNKDLQDGPAERLATKSTSIDAENMRRLGKQPQLVRRFRLFSIASFITLSTVSWEYGVFTLGPGLTNGGRSGLIYSTLWSFIGFGPIYLSMAEMASMAPTAGAQYHWVSEFAPESCQRVLSYLTGCVFNSNTIFRIADRSIIAGVLRWLGRLATLWACSFSEALFNQ
jgi:amino acid transporter